MFGLAEADLAGSILGCGDGPAGYPMYGECLTATQDFTDKLIEQIVGIEITVMRLLGKMESQLESTGGKSKQPDPGLTQIRQAGNGYLQDIKND